MTTQIEISNDLFFYLRDGEEPIDEDSLLDLPELEAEYPDGLDIIDWYYADKEGYIVATIEVHEIGDMPFDKEFEMFNNWFFQFKINPDGMSCNGRWYNHKTREEFENGTWLIQKINGKLWAMLKGTTQLPIYKVL